MADDANKNLQHLLLVDALIKEKKEPSDAERIYDSVRQLQFLKNLFSSGDTIETEDNAIELCYQMKYEKHSMGTFVFKEKDESNGKFYVILSGEVGVITNANLKNVYEKDHAQSATSRKPSLSFLDTGSLSARIKERSNIGSGLTNIQVDIRRNPPFSHGPMLNGMYGVTKKLISTRKFAKKLGKKVQKKHENEDDINKVDLKDGFAQLVHRSGYGELRHILRKGNYFGDAALTEPGAVRSASILCKTDCEFLVLDHQTFNSFVKKGQQKKTDFLWKSFSFLNRVSSSQVKNLIFYSFKSTGFAEGNVVTLEGAPATMPIFYVIENGECKVEKMMSIDVRHPFNKELIRKERRWVTVCHIAPGTIVGEEILLQPDGEEVYEYKVTVTSKKASMFWIEKSIFLGIHPALEEQLRKFYEIKKQQRKCIFDEIVREYKETISKYFTHDKNPFLSEYGMVAKMLNGASLNQLSKKSTSKRTMIHSSLSPRNLTASKTSESDKKTDDSPKSVMSKKEFNFTRSSLFVQGTLSPRSDYVLADFSPSPQHNALKVKGTLSDTLTQPNSAKQSDFSWYHPRRITLDDEDCQKEKENQHELDAEKNLGLALEKIEKENSILNQLKRTSKKQEKEYKFIRKNKKETSDLYSETIRESTQALARMAFIDQFKISEESPKSDDIRAHRFAFSYGISSRNEEITKMKTLGHGVFASSRGPNYLKNQHNLAEFVQNKIIDRKLTIPTTPERDALVVKASVNQENTPKSARDFYIKDRTFSSPSLLKGSAYKGMQGETVSPFDSNTLEKLKLIVSINSEGTSRARANTSAGSPDPYRQPLSAKQSISSPRSGVSMDTSFRAIQHQPNNKTAILHQKADHSTSQQGNSSDSIYKYLLQASENKRKLSRSGFKSRNIMQKLATTHT